MDAQNLEFIAKTLDGFLGGGERQFILEPSRENTEDARPPAPVEESRKPAWNVPPAR